MAKNPLRRDLLADASISVMGERGSRALTHRAVDRAAGVPLGTASNYFPTRADLFMGAAKRAFAVLQPSPDALDRLANLPSDAETAAAYARDVADRLLRKPEIALALIEMRLEARRDPALGTLLSEHLRRGLADDIAFHVQRGLPGGPDDISLLHHLTLGVVLDALTVPLAPDRNPLDAVETMTRRQLSRE